MMFRVASIALGIGLLTSFGLVAPAAAEDCPAKSLQFEDIQDAIAAAPTCNRAMEIFGACEFGASGDVDLGVAVRQKCEGDFLAKLKDPQKHVYLRELRACDRKYANKSGTMYLSFAAFCSAEVSQRYSQQALKLSQQRSR